jgi:hypothetical protein
LDGETICEWPQLEQRNRNGRPELTTQAGGSSSCSTLQFSHWIFKVAAKD